MDRRAAIVRLFVFYLSLELVRVYEIEISLIGQNNGNHDLVCEEILSDKPVPTIEKDTNRTAARWQTSDVIVTLK